ncbi:MAG: hypothetical protein IID33_02835 [Planctomycetes bacterium]|nr:hypothetical protein [Planctomycetota bacterium]
MRLCRTSIWTTAVVVLTMSVGCALEDPLVLPLGGVSEAKSDALPSRIRDFSPIDGCDPCDMNCDGRVDAVDIEPFIGLLFDGDPPCDTCTGDTNGDGRIDALDIEPFIDCLFSAGNGNSNGGNGNTNGGNGNANGGNGNTNGGNGNANGGNGNTNGGNGNANGDLCADGSFRVRADLLSGGRANGRMEYRVLPGGCRRFRTRVDDFPTGIFDVLIEGIFVGEIMTDGRGRGELLYDSSLGNFPPDFPEVFVGDIGDVGGVASGVLSLDCSSLNGNCNAGNGNANGGNGNSNGGNGNANGGNGNANGGNGNANGGNGNANGP